MISSEQYCQKEKEKEKIGILKNKIVFKTWKICI